MNVVIVYETLPPPSLNRHMRTENVSLRKFSIINEGWLHISKKDDLGK